MWKTCIPERGGKLISSLPRWKRMSVEERPMVTPDTVNVLGSETKWIFGRSKAAVTGSVVCSGGCGYTGSPGAGPCCWTPPPPRCPGQLSPQLFWTPRRANGSRSSCWTRQYASSCCRQTDRAARPGSVCLSWLQSASRPMAPGRHCRTWWRVRRRPGWRAPLPGPDWRPPACHTTGRGGLRLSWPPGVIR